MTTILGPGTLELGGTDYAAECSSASITHEYEDVGENRTMLDGSAKVAGQRRIDGLTAEIENDLTPDGLYAYLVANDGSEVPFTYTPNDEDGASWSGTVRLRLPDTIGADEYAAPIVSSIELTGVGIFTFTPIATTPPE